MLNWYLKGEKSNLFGRMLSTCVPKFAKNIDEDVRIGSTSFHIRSNNANDVFIIWKTKAKSKKTFEKQSLNLIYIFFCVTNKFLHLGMSIWSMLPSRSLAKRPSPSSLLSQLLQAK